MKQTTMNDDIKKEVPVLDIKKTKENQIEINFENMKMIDDYLAEINRIEECLNFYKDIVHSVVKTGNIDDIKKMNLYICKEQIRDRQMLDFLKEEYNKFVKTCDHAVKVDFGAGYHKCLICEAENDNCLDRIFPRRKTYTVYVENYMKKYGRCFDKNATDKAFYQIKEKLFELLDEYQKNGEEVDINKLVYDLAVYTHGYTQKVKKIGSRKISYA